MNNSNPWGLSSPPTRHYEPAFGLSAPAHHYEPAFGLSAPVHHYEPAFGATLPGEEVLAIVGVGGTLLFGAMALFHAPLWAALLLGCGGALGTKLAIDRTAAA